MKILLDARFYGLENAGLGRYTINLLENLPKIDNKNSYSVLLRKKYFDRLNFPKNWKKVLADIRHYSLAEQILLPKIINNEKPDIVHFLNFNYPIFYRGKFIVTIHDLLMKKHKTSNATTLPFYLFYPKHLAAKYTMRNAILKAEKIIVPSAAVKNEVLEQYKVDESKIKAIYEGVDIEVKSEQISNKIEKPYFLYVGNAYPHKNLDRLIEAVIRIKTRLVIASSRDVFTRQLEEKVKRGGNEKYIKILGFVPDKELGGLYKNAAAFIYPSLSEGFGLPGLEAMASGTPVLASNIPVFKEIYKDKAIYFDPYSVNQIEESMNKALGMDDAKRQLMIKENQSFVKQYSWSKMAQETLEVYNSIGLNYGRRNS